MAYDITTSANLPTIVDDIRARAFAYQQEEGVWKRLVTEVGMGQKGNSVTIPVWDPTGGTAVNLTEGVDLTDAVEYVNTDVNITAAESGLMTVLTKNDIEDATDDVKERHATYHGITLANKVELLGHAAGQTLTKHLDYSGAELTDLHIALMKADRNASTIKGAGNWNLVGSSGIYLGVLASLSANPSFGIKGNQGQAVLDKYFVGNLFGDVDLYQTDIPYDATAANHVGAFFKSDAIGMFAPRKFELEYEPNASLRGTELVSSQRYGFKVKADKLGLRFTCANGLLTAPSARGIAKIEVVNTEESPVLTQEVASLS